MRKTPMFSAAIVVLGLAAWSTACVSYSQSLPTPTMETGPVDQTQVVTNPSFARDVQPILREFCITCHGSERAENGLRLDSYEYTMRGSNSGAVVIPGWPEASTLVYVMRRPEDQDIAMPYHGKRLTPNRIKNVMNWIEKGAADN